jgi:hypothetical protein
LIETDDRGVVLNISEGSEDFVELESGIGVETTGSIVPEVRTSAMETRFFSPPVIISLIQVNIEGRT